MSLCLECKELTDDGFHFIKMCKKCNEKKMEMINR